MVSRRNNFDLIRLLAACQVILVHAIGRTPLHESAPGWLLGVLRFVMLFPGVPVFFTLSGFLVARSWESNRDQPARFFLNRALRIYPALLVCFGVTLAILALCGHLGRSFLLSKEFCLWAAGQVTVAQFLNPEHFRNFGVGVVNGSLWTISVELQFYLFLPIIHEAMWRGRPTKTRWNALLAVSAAVSVAAFLILDIGTNQAGGFAHAPAAMKALFVTLLPYWWMFLLGILAHRHFGKVRPWLEGKALWYLGAYVLVAAGREFGFGREAAWVYYSGYVPERILLAALTLSAAYTAQGCSDRLLGGRDYSYGLYIYHFLVINILVHSGWPMVPALVLWVAAGALALAAMSWHLVEKPSLAWKGAFTRLRVRSADTLRSGQ